MYKVAEWFVSINGEGRRAGELATFIRFTGCNLNCTYCDTAWAIPENAEKPKDQRIKSGKYIKESRKMDL